MDSRNNQLARFSSSSHTRFSIFSPRQAGIAGALAILSPSVTASNLDIANDPALFYGLVIGIPVGIVALFAVAVTVLCYLKGDCCFHRPTAGRRTLT